MQQLCTALQTLCSAIVLCPTSEVNLVRELLGVFRKKEDIYEVSKREDISCSVSGAKGKILQVVNSYHTADYGVYLN